MPKLIIDQAAVWSRSALESPDPPKFPNHLVVIWQDQKTGWRFCARIPHRNLGQFTAQDLDNFSVWIPPAHYQPPVDPYITCSDIHASSGETELYCKTPRLIGYDGTSGLAAKLQREVYVLEQLKDNPHPNLCEYFGCKVDSSAGLVTGVYLKKYPYSLDAFLQGRPAHGPVPSTMSRDRLVQGIREGVAHLHKLGMAHNDLSPSNIMIDETGNAIIIDFDNCTPFQQACRKGTPDYSLHSTVSSAENDHYAVERIVAALDARIAYLRQRQLYLYQHHYQQQQQQQQQGQQSCYSPQAFIPA